MRSSRVAHADAASHVRTRPAAHAANRLRRPDRRRAADRRARAGVLRRRRARASRSSGSSAGATSATGSPSAQLDATHALLGMPLFSRLGRDWFVEPLVALMNLGSGGNAITLSRRLIDAGVRSAATLARVHPQRPARRGDGLRARLQLLDAPLPAARLARVGAGSTRTATSACASSRRTRWPGTWPAGTSTGSASASRGTRWPQHNGAGQIVAVTTDILPAHPEKVLAVTRALAGRAHEPLLVPLIRAVLRGCAFCEDERNHARWRELLATPDVPRHAGRADPPEPGARSRRSRASRVGRGRARADWRVPQLRAATHVPEQDARRVAGVADERWRQLPRDVDAHGDRAARCADSTAYRAAAASLGIDCPPTISRRCRCAAAMFDPHSRRASAHASRTRNGRSIPSEHRRTRSPAEPLLKAAGARRRGVAAERAAVQLAGRRPTRRTRPSVADMNFGIIALTDCSPIVIAHEKGFFKKYGINSTVTKIASWAAIRDALANGDTQAHAHAHRHADRLDDGPRRQRRRSRWSSPGCSTATGRRSRSRRS